MSAVILFFIFAAQASHGCSTSLRAFDSIDARLRITAVNIQYFKYPRRNLPFLIVPTVDHDDDRRFVAVCRALFVSFTRLSFLSSLLSVVYAGVDHLLSPVLNLEYLRSHPSAALPPSPLTPRTLAMSLRPQAPLPSALLTTTGSWSTDREEGSDAPISPSSAYIVDSPSAVQQSSAMNAPPGSRTVSRKNSEDGSFMSDVDQPDSARSPKLPNLPDPNQFPEPPYPYKPRQWQHGTSTPTLSSAASSASTRSSAYTSYARSGDFGHVHVAVGGEDTGPNMEISTEHVAQLLAREKSLPSAPTQSRVPIPEEQRWSYTQSTRSRSSSLVNGRADSGQDFGSPALRGTTSFDNNWETVEEKDETGLTSEDETDDDAFLAEEDLEEEREEQATSAMMVVEEGRGIIVRGTHVPIAQLQVNSGVLLEALTSSSFRMLTHMSRASCGRYNTFINWIVKHPKCSSGVPHPCHTANFHDAALSRHLCQFPQRPSLFSPSSYMSRGAEYCIQSSSGAPRFPCWPHLSTCSNRRFHWD